MAEPSIQLLTDVATGRPIIIPLELFERHVWCQGMTGARKTILAVMIIRQLMRLHPTAAFALADLGGDQCAFNQIREQAQQLNKPFQFLSVNQDDDWDSLDPMAAITPLGDLSVAVSYLHSILGGDHGEGYQLVELDDPRIYFHQDHYGTLAAVCLYYIREGTRWAFITALQIMLLCLGILVLMVLDILFG
jgi:hypothetical protein